MQAALGASRVGFGGAKQAAAVAPRITATPSGRRAPTMTDAVLAVADAASASSSFSSLASSSETRLTRPEHGGRQLDIPGSSSQARRRSRRAGRNDGFAAGVVVAASASASASAAPSFEQAEASSSSALKEASASPSHAEGESCCRRVVDCELAGKCVREGRGKGKAMLQAPSGGG